MQITLDAVYAAEILVKLGQEEGLKFIARLGRLEEQLELAVVQCFVKDDLVPEKVADILAGVKTLNKLAGLNLLGDRKHKKLEVRAIIPVDEASQGLADEVFDFWNTQGLPKVMTRSPARKSKIRKRIRNRDAFDAFKKVIEELLFEKPTLKRQEWFDFDYVFRSDSTFEKVMQKRVYAGKDEKAGTSAEAASNDLETSLMGLIKRSSASRTVAVLEEFRTWHLQKKGKHLPMTSILKDAMIDVCKEGTEQLTASNTACRLLKDTMKLLDKILGDKGLSVSFNEYLKRND